MTCNKNCDKCNKTNRDNKAKSLGDDKAGQLPKTARGEIRVSVIRDEGKEMGKVNG